MLRSYSAFYKQGQLEWLDDVPEVENMRVIVTFIENVPSELSAKEKILKQAWGCVESPKTQTEIDNDIAQMRREWE